MTRGGNDERLAVPARRAEGLVTAHDLPEAKIETYTGNPYVQGEPMPALEPGDIQWCGDEQVHDPHPWSDVVCPGIKFDD